MTDDPLREYRSVYTVSACICTAAMSARKKENTFYWYSIVSPWIHDGEFGYRDIISAVLRRQSWTYVSLAMSCRYNSRESMKEWKVTYEIAFTLSWYFCDCNVSMIRKWVRMNYARSSMYYRWKIEKRWVQWMSFSRMRRLDSSRIYWTKSIRIQSAITIPGKKGISRADCFGRSSFFHPA